jgi:hypothetical protein
MGTKNSEARVIANYLLGITPSTPSEQLYEEGLRELDIRIDPNNARQWNICLRHPILLPFVDAGLAMIDPHNPIRRRINLMFAILETDPGLADKFLINTNKVSWYFQYAYYGSRAVFRSIVGLIIVKLI